MTNWYLLLISMSYYTLPITSALLFNFIMLLGENRRLIHVSVVLETIINIWRQIKIFANDAGNTYNFRPGGENWTSILFFTLLSLSLYTPVPHRYQKLGVGCTPLYPAPRLRRPCLSTLFLALLYGCDSVNTAIFHSFPCMTSHLGFLLITNVLRQMATL